MSNDPVITPGMKTSEFVVTLLVIIIGSVLASGLLTDSTSVKIAGIAMATLKAVMFTWSRTAIKTANSGIVVETMTSQPAPAQTTNIEVNK